MSFKQHFQSLTEAGVARTPKSVNLNGFTPPTGRSTFDVGDFVAVSAPKVNELSSAEFFRLWNPKYALPYLNEIGTVELSKSSAYATKFAVRFDDGSLIPIDKRTLVGPFASREIAEKYKGVHSKEVSGGDLKGFVDNAIEVDQKIETTFKNAFCNDKLNFKWLEEPIIFEYKNFDVHVLAFKKNAFEQSERDRSEKLNFMSECQIDRESRKVYEEYSNGFVFFKVIDKLTSRLKKTSVFSPKFGTYFIQSPVFESWVFIHSGVFENGKVIDYRKLFDYDFVPITNVERNKESILNYFNWYENEKPTEGIEVFKMMNEVNDKTLTIKSRDSKEVWFNENMLGERMTELAKYKVEKNSVRIEFLSTTDHIKFVPSHVNSSFIQIRGERLKSLEGLANCNFGENFDRISITAKYIDNLKGFPEQLNKEGFYFDLTSSTVNNLVGIPEELKCDLHIGKLNSFAGARNCTTDAIVSVRDCTQDLTDFFEKADRFNCWNIDKKAIKDYKKYRNLEDKLPELEGIFS